MITKNPVLVENRQYCNNCVVKKVWVFTAHKPFYNISAIKFPELMIYDEDIK